MQTGLYSGTEEFAAAGLSRERYEKRLFTETSDARFVIKQVIAAELLLHELLDMSDNIREMIIARRPGSEVRRAAQEEGLGSLRESALQKVFRGETTLHEINRVTFVEAVAVGT